MTSIMEKRPELMKYINVDFTDRSILDRTPFRRRRSPLIVTLNDPKITPVDIRVLMESGLNVARFPTSQTTRGDKIRMLGKVDKAAAVLSGKLGVPDYPVATCVELKTCIVNTGILEDEKDFIMIKQGTQVYLTNNIQEYDKCNERRIFVDNPNLQLEVKIGTEISIDEDEIVLQCKEVCEDKRSLRCVVTKGGKLTHMCLVSARGDTRTRPYITKKDLQIVRFAMEYQVDMIIINYARSKISLQKVKQYVGRKKRPLLICGICTPEGLENIDDLIKEADGIMLAREFLAYELDARDKHKMGNIQKMIGAKCQMAGKPFYLCGGIFQEGLVDGKITNHEISDVTNALLDGVTGFVLKDGHVTDLIVNVIRVINDVCCYIEPFTNNKNDFWRILDTIKMPINAAEAAAMSCAIAINQTNARVIVLPTVTGKTAKALVRFRPNCIIITVSNRKRTTRLLMTYRCVVPLTYNFARSKRWERTIESRVNFAIEHAVKTGWLEYGDAYVSFYKGSDHSSFCDTVRIMLVSISRKNLVECPDSEEDNNIS